jgi:hypothetical protein
MSVIIDGSNGITTPDVLSNQDALGYTTGAGGTVTQLTSKSTAVTLNKPTGQITMNNAALASGATVQFTLNNSSILINDLLLVCPNANVGTGGAYTVICSVIAGGGAVIRVTNITGVSLSEAFEINFAIIKGATS